MHMCMAACPSAAPRRSVTAAALSRGADARQGDALLPPRRCAAGCRWLQPPPQLPCRRASRDVQFSRRPAAQRFSAQPQQEMEAEEEQELERAPLQVAAPEHLSPICRPTLPIDSERARSVKMECGDAKSGLRHCCGAAAQAT